MDQKPIPMCAGWVLTGMIFIIKSYRDKTLVKEVIQAMPGPTQRIFDKNIIASEWYPYAGFSGLLIGLEMVIGNGDGAVARTFGVIGGEAAMEQLFAVYKLREVDYLMRAGAKIWDRHFRNAGRAEFSSLKPQHSSFRIWNFPEMHSLHFCQLEGWVKGAFSKVGAMVLGDVKMVKPMDEQTPYHEFVCQWMLKMS